MVETLTLRELRLRKQNTKRTVPLDAVPERRTKRCPPRYLPAKRFCELSFRYLTSPAGSEGEKCRPLDHMWQIPFIHSARFIYSINYCIYGTVFQIHPPCGTFKRVLVSRISYKCARALRKHSFQGSIPISKFCCVPYGTCRCILARGEWYVPMRICCTNEIVQDLVSYHEIFIFFFLCLIKSNIRIWNFKLSTPLGAIGDSVSSLYPVLALN